MTGPGDAARPPPTTPPLPAVVPHPASGAQVQSQGVRALNVYGNVHIHPATSDVQRELQAQFTGIAR